MQYGVTEVFVFHDYYSSLRVKLLRKEGDNLVLLKDSGSEFTDVKYIETEKKIYTAPEGFLTAIRDYDLFYIYESGEYSIPRYKYILHKGSSRSSKSWSIEEWCVRQCEENQNKRITVWRDTRTSLGDTIWKDFKKLFPLSGRKYSFPQNTFPIHFPATNSIIEPHGADSTNAHGNTADIAWLNEPYRISKETFDQIDQRCEQMIIDLNPKQSHWSDDLSKHPRCKVIHSTFMKNPFCPPEQKRKILSYDPNNPINVKNKTADAYNWDVYGLGLKAEKPNRIFKAWNKITLDEWNNLPYNSYFGMDFGTTNPSSLVELKYADGCFFVRKRMYKPMNKMQMGDEFNAGGITKELELMKIKKSDIIIADSADKNNRLDIQRNGYNIMPAKKGADSVIAGINLINKFKTYYVEDEELEYEYENYEWEVVNGVNLDRPIKKDDHILDGFRYVHTWLCNYLSIK